MGSEHKLCRRLKKYYSINNCNDKNYVFRYKNIIVHFRKFAHNL